MSAVLEAEALPVRPVVERHNVVCRVCHEACDLIVEMAGGVPGKIYGDKNNPAYRGYSCAKGRAFASYASAPQRLLHPSKRAADGSYQPIESRQAIAEIADKLGEIVAKHGPRAVAFYVGTHGYNDFPAHAYAGAVLDALGSPMLFNAVSIDQPGKAIGLALHGPWLAGTPPMARWESLLLVGTNPIVSMNGGLGANPAGRLHEAKKRGLKLVVIDPRRTEVAALADVHLQVRPGEDPAVLAGMARVIITEGLYDAAFVEDNTVGLAALAEAVAPFTPDLVAARAGIDPDALVRAARLFAAGRSGAVSAGTGTNMAGHGNVTEYFVKVLTTLKGFWLREGETITNPGVMVNRAPPIAASPGPFPAAGYGHKMRIRGLEETPAGLPTATLAEEILLPGDGQVKALFVFGGNPMVAWPDQPKTHAAMQALDLLVCFDPVMSATARLAHYVMAPRMGLEVTSTTMHNEMFGNFGPGWGYEEPYAQYSAPLLAPPPGSDLVQEWEVLHEISRRLGLKLRLRDWSFYDPAQAKAGGTDVDMTRTPTADEVWAMITRHSPVPFAEVKRLCQPGRVLDVPPAVVQPRPSGWAGRLDIGSREMLAELSETLAEHDRALDGAYPFRLISRRLHDVVNSCWHDAPKIRARVAGNGAYMHPDDLTAVGCVDGDTVRIDSRVAQIAAIVRADPTIRPGCISMSHSWGGNPGEDDDPALLGGNTGRLVPVDREYDRYTGIPRMSAIPVRLSRINQAMG
jgi:anaerobic selenocysteine-containing dehydrogenase